MRISVKRIQPENINLLPVFLAGAATGFLIMNLGKSILLGTGLFDEDTLYNMKYMTVGGNALFYYVFRKRMLAFFGMAVLATTYLGFVICVAAAFWSGMAIGTYVTVLMLRYGFKGVILAVIGVFPQCLLYIPAIVMMLGWSEGVYKAVYSGGGEADRAFWIKKIGKLGIIAAVILGGCLAEGYVNPVILTGYLKIF